MKTNDLLNSVHYTELREQLRRCETAQEASALLQRCYTAASKTRDLPPDLLHTVRAMLPEIEGISDSPHVVRYELGRFARVACRPDERWQLQGCVTDHTGVVVHWLHDAALASSAATPAEQDDAYPYCDSYENIVETVLPILARHHRLTTAETADIVDAEQLRQTLDDAYPRVHKTRGGWFTVRHPYADNGLEHTLVLSVRRKGRQTVDTQITLQ